ncbi:ABC transporter permease [Acetonema longum]|uniref:ABC transporter, permease protein n=1 Tax=Acetonema longum DSM 6540 TaxID=1009370 RepID=F7NJW8_9FIRM|nr:ABC transporter permease [Acetonema longum]EGO63615.1 ABC transporter, permease protein [Acetonema longum DSM 6540]
MSFHKQKEGITLLATILLGLAAGALFMMLAGHDPLSGYKFLFRGGLMNLERVGNTLATATPLIFTGLSVAFAFKTGLFNIGAAGQMLFGGFCATAVGLTWSLDKPALLFAMTLTAMLAGALWAALPGWFKARFNVHEVVSTIMFNWMAYWLVYYLVPLYFKGSFETESRNIPLAASLRTPWLSQMFDGSYMNIGLVLALAAVAFCAFLLQRTTLGFELKAVGFNRFAAEYAGIHAGRSIVVSMMLAGALAGLGGMTLYCGYATNIQIGVLPSQGIDGIAVALLGANSPWGVLAAAIFFGVLYSGKGFMNAMTSIPPEIADTIIATIIYFAATSVLLEKFLSRLWRKQQSEEGA